MSRISNLLPQEYKQRYSLYVVLLHVKRFLYAQIMVLLALIVLLSGWYTYQSAKLSQLRAAQADFENFQQSLDVDGMQAFANLNNDAVRAASLILKARPSLSVVFDELVKVLPGGVTLDFIDVQTAPPKLEIKGRAATREQVVILQSRLEQSSILKMTYAPLSNLTAAQDGLFHFMLTFEMKKIALPAE